MSSLTGRFYYRLTTNGNLVGEFSNNHSTRSQPETAERIGGTVTAPFGFEGKYQSTWFEPDDDQAVLAQLKITQKPGTHQLFNLSWTVPSSTTPLFEGEAMIGEGLLIGNYWMNRS